MIKQFGRLNKVNLRVVRSKEAGDFTPCLALEGNLSRQGESVFRTRVKQLDASVFDPQTADESGSFSDNGAS